MDLPKELQDEIWEYCRVNKITNLDEFVIKMTTQGFTVEKFGATPYTKEPDTIIKTVEKIVEVPVEKEVYITNDSNTQELAQRLLDVREEYKIAADRIRFLEEENLKIQEEWAKKLKIEDKDNDIYREDQKGLYGSNTKDIYGK